MFSVDIFEQILRETDNWESFTYCISSEDLNLIHDMSLKNSLIPRLTTNQAIPHKYEISLLEANTQSLQLWCQRILW